MTDNVQPTRRELEILAVLWRLGEATVRQVYEAMREDAPIVQNTVQAFLRTMEEKGLVEHRLDGRAFVYRPKRAREQTGRHLVGRLLDNVFDGAIDQLVDSLFSHHPPTRDELARLESIITAAKRKQNTTSGGGQTT